MKRKPPFYWTKERCIEDAKQYTSKTEWSAKSRGAYHSAHKNKWLDECCGHMEKNKKPNNYWTKERCIEDAKQYKTKKEWREKSGSAYYTATKGRYLDECCKHMDRLGSLYERLIYVYIFPDKFVYVGLTCNEKRRKKEHLFEKRPSSVIKHILKTGLEPKYKKLTNYIPENEASIVEEEYIKRYKRGGYKLLNKIKGGNLGGNLQKWTKEKCIEDAKKYKKRSEWAKKSKKVYQAACRNKWLDECCEHMENYFKWTKEKCIEDAKKYKTRTEWRTKSGSAYSSAIKNKWLDECCKHMDLKRNSNGYWTKEHCIEDAKKYKTRREWCLKSSGAYFSATKNKWLDECCEHMKINKFLTHECTL